MKIHTIINTVAGENTYLLESDHGVLVIDPGSDWPKIETTLQEIQKPVLAILLTHTHYDHIMSVEAVRQHFNQPPLYVSEKEASWLQSPEDNLSGLPRHDDMANIVVAPAEYTFELRKLYTIGNFSFTVVPTPGHSWGSVSFIFSSEETIFSGDALFKETIGRTDLPTGNFDELISGIRQELFTQPNHFAVYPGHGHSTTIAHEKNFNPYFK
ncbi:MBL fold metallo-hydrolase [Streptococcus hyovaginalis]|uniref:MBL fold metallo-hydrolase n=1 Tax=Streptococcus hyovaginalis TaxID=149015 RepID=UPI002A7DE57E|nr:MBL fold metallo-hydrolase [Streptococcus hyovaginalis]MDY3024742.1 MBL fold metallo-hydrolase [Streptococcus hyovaginalis]MDY4510544.1 MBL fold metallo-hydrolase [Streptococcus hyovaginalis]MDY5974800.1 MBL fold metallo-hydrolase [Streptococcus hyovaginalis]